MFYLTGPTHRSAVYRIGRTAALLAALVITLVITACSPSSSTGTATMQPSDSSTTSVVPVVTTPRPYASQYTGTYASQELSGGTSLALHGLRITGTLYYRINFGRCYDGKIINESGDVAMCNVTLHMQSTSYNGKRATFVVTAGSYSYGPDHGSIKIPAGTTATITITGPNTAAIKLKLRAGLNNEPISALLYRPGSM